MCHNLPSDNFKEYVNNSYFHVAIIAQIHSNFARSSMRLKCAIWKPSNHSKKKKKKKTVILILYVQIFTRAMSIQVAIKALRRVNATVQLFFWPIPGLKIKQVLKNDMQKCRMHKIKIIISTVNQTKDLFNKLPHFIQINPLGTELFFSSFFGT